MKPRVPTVKNPRMFPALFEQLESRCMLSVALNPTVQNTDAISGAQTHAIFTIIPNNNSDNGRLLAATTGQEFSGSIGTILIGNDVYVVGKPYVQINWGDNTSSGSGFTDVKLVQINDQGEYDIVGSHTYLTAGTYSIYGFVHAEFGPKDEPGHITPDWMAVGILGDVYSTAIVSNPTNDGLQIQPMNIKGTQDSVTTFSAIFTDSNPTLPASRYTATIIWGDGTISTGTIVKADGFSVTADHNYITPGQFDVTLSISVSDGRTAVGNGLAIIQPGVAEPFLGALQLDGLSTDPLALPA